MTPKYTLADTALKTIGGSFILWGILFFLIYFYLNNYMGELKGKEEWVKYYNEAKMSDKMLYVAYCHAIFHALFSGFGAIYCMFYADG